MRVRVLRGEQDRWGRTAALVFAPEPETGRSLSVSEAMLDAGLARARPEPAVGVCWPSYLAIEAAARQRGAGLWSDPTYAVVAASDTAALSARTGTMAVVEGRTTALREGRARRYLPMDGRGRSGFSITVEKRAALRMRKAGTDPASWAGKHLRVRGFLDDRFGLQIEVSSPDQVESLEP